MLIETDRLVITELTMDMAEDVRENSLDEDTRRFVPDEVFETAEEAQETVKYLMCQYGTLEGPLVYAVLIKTDRKNIGYVQMVPIGGGKWEIGYHIAKRYTGSGYATEAVRAFLPVMAGKLSIQEVTGICLNDNVASRRVLRKSGFREVFTGTGEYQGQEREIARYLWKPAVIETERLLLREYTPDDFGALYEILSDPETMQHYPAPFDEERTRKWITWNLDNYEKYGFGLWAVVLKDTGEFIGDCGITIQDIDGEMLPEIGYHIHKRHWRKGYASEAARAVRDWVFRNTDYNTVYSYMKYTNVGSYRTAEANGMRKVKEYPDPKNTVSYAYAITRSEWETLTAGKG